MKRQRLLARPIAIGGAFLSARCILGNEPQASPATVAFAFMAHGDWGGSAEGNQSTATNIEATRFLSPAKT
jgi:hypothetical protein